MPQITQLLSIGLGILASPMDLKNMVEWLNVPLSPLKSGLRNSLEKSIARKGGYYNEKCRGIIESFINCNNEYTDMEEAERKKKTDSESNEGFARPHSIFPMVPVVTSHFSASSAWDKFLFCLYFFRLEIKSI